MKYCIHCGKAHAEIPKFCSNCGTAWNAPKQNIITRARKESKREDFDEDDDEEEDDGPTESIAALLGGAKKAIKATATGARVFKGSEIANDPNFFAIQDEREQRAANYNFHQDMARVRETPKGEIN